MTTAWWETRWLLSATAWTVAGLGALAFTWALCRDRSRGRTRCPKCWYDLAGLVKPEAPSPWPITCPECGKKIEHERQTRRTRRHWRLAALALTMMLAAYPIAHIADAREFGPQRLLPLWLQAVAWPVGEVSTYVIPNSDTELDTVLSACGRAAGSSRWRRTPLQDICFRLQFDAPASWYERVFVWRLVRALRFSDPTTETRVFSYARAWDVLRREAPWRSRAEVRESDARLRMSLYEPSLSGLHRTKDEWICDQAMTLTWVLVDCVATPSDRMPIMVETIGSSMVFAGPPEMMQKIDVYHDALWQAATGGNRFKLDLATDMGLTVAFRNIVDAISWTGDDGYEVLEAALDPLHREHPPLDAQDIEGIWRFDTDLGGSVLVVIATPATMREVDAKLDELRAERAGADQRIHNTP